MWATHSGRYSLTTMSSCSELLWPYIKGGGGGNGISKCCILRIISGNSKTPLAVLRMPDVNRVAELRRLRESDRHWNTALPFNLLSYFSSNFRTSCFLTYHIRAEILLGAYFYRNGFQLRKRNYFKTCISSCLRQSCVLSIIIHNTDFKHHEFPNLMENGFFLNIKAYQAKSLHCRVP